MSYDPLVTVLYLSCKVAVLNLKFTISPTTLLFTMKVCREGIVASI
jgi:hypothetical protein